MSMKILDMAGLGYFWTKLKSYFVSKTGNETVSGNITFTGTVSLQSNYPELRNKIVNTAKGTPPALDSYHYLGWYDNSDVLDNVSRYGSAGIALFANGDVRSGCLAFKNEAGSSSYAGLFVFYPASGDPYATAPATPAAGTSNDVVTRGYMQSWVANSANAFSASKLATARNMKVSDADNSNQGAVSTFDGSASVILNLPSTIKATLTGNASTATKLAAPVTINDVSFDGSANITVADSTKVSKSGDTMTGNLAIKKNGPVLSLINNQVEIDVTTAQYEAKINFFDKNEHKLSSLITRNYSDKSSYTYLRSFSFVSTNYDNVFADISVGFDKDGNVKTSAPNPSASSNTNEIATTKWVRTATGDFACNAATASAFASSKNVTLTGAVTGTASSTGGWSVSTVWRSCIVGRTDSGTSNPWYKVASRKLNGGSSAYNITFYIENANTVNKSFGILRASVNTNSDKTINTGATKFAWLVNDGFAEEDFVLVCPATAEPTVELWTKVATGYLRKRFVVISEGGSTSTGLVWTLFDAMSAGQEASIPTEGTQVTSGYAIKTELSAKADDSAVVHNTGDESVSGIKYFSDTIRASTIVAQTADTSMILRAATSSGDGASLTLYSKNDTSKPSVLRAVPRNGSIYTVLEAWPDGTFTWGGQPIQTSSDERLKTPLSSVPDAVLDAWEAVQWGSFQYLDAVERKGASARLHLGLIAQRVKSVFEKRGLDACAYGILCYDGDEDMWTVRYAEALAMEAACQRRRADRLEARVKALEEALR